MRQQATTGGAKRKGGQGTQGSRGGAGRPVHARPAPASAFDTPLRADARAVIERTVAGLHYEVVDIERAARGLLRVTIDRVPGQAYPTGESEFVTVEDCEAVTRQLQYVLEVEQVDYARLEVSSPGLDRPLRREADLVRFAGSEVSVTLREPFNGRKHFRGRLLAAEAPASGWRLEFTEGKTAQVLGFAFDEVREARLVPVVDFKGRRGRPAEVAPTGEPAPSAAPVDDGG